MGTAHEVHGANTKVCGVGAVHTCSSSSPSSGAAAELGNLAPAPIQCCWFSSSHSSTINGQNIQFLTVCSSSGLQPSHHKVSNAVWLARKKPDVMAYPPHSLPSSVKNPCLPKAAQSFFPVVILLCSKWPSYSHLKGKKKKVSSFFMGCCLNISMSAESLHQTFPYLQTQMTFTEET